MDDIDKNVKNLDKRFTGLEIGLVKITELLEHQMNNKKSSSPEKNLQHS